MEQTVSDKHNRDHQPATDLPAEEPRQGTSASFLLQDQKNQNRQNFAAAAASPPVVRPIWKSLTCRMCDWMVETHADAQVHWAEAHPEVDAPAWENILTERAKNLDENRANRAAKDASSSDGANAAVTVKVGMVPLPPDFDLVPSGKPGRPKKFGRRRRIFGEKKLPPVLCEPCNLLLLNNKQSFTVHLLSKKHIKNAELAANGSAEVKG